ncbi:MAG: hypothetical protein E7213_00300 [Clostridium sp.]|nr:hypothetical protein [Clostridium sp.]
MYQMYAYSKKYEASEIWLLYPINDEMRGHASIEFVIDENTKVRLHFVDLVDIEKNLEELKCKIDEQV